MTATWGISKGDLFLMNAEQARKVNWMRFPNARFQASHFEIRARVIEKNEIHQDVAVAKHFVLFEDGFASFLVTKPRALKKGSLHLFPEEPQKYDPETYVVLPKAAKPIKQHYHYGLLSLHTNSSDYAFYAYIENDELNYYLLQRKNGGG